MVISDRYKYLYFVIPKCGSATVRHALEPYTDIGYPVSSFAEHVTIPKFLDKYDDAGRFDTHFKFTFVRNPYDRIYSGYRQDMFASTQWDHWIKAKKPIFDTIGDDFNTYMLDYVARADVLNGWDWISFCPMVAFTHRDDRLALNWIGRTETLDRDLAALGDRLGVTFQTVRNFNVRVPQSEIAPGALKYRDRYTRGTVALVNELYADDFAAFGYPVLEPNDFPAIL